MIIFLKVLYPKKNCSIYEKLPRYEPLILETSVKGFLYLVVDLSRFSISVESA